MRFFSSSSAHVYFDVTFKLVIQLLLSTKNVPGDLSRTTIDGLIKCRTL